MPRKFKLIVAIFALGFWAMAPSAASAGGKHGGHGRHNQDRYHNDDYERGDDREYRRRDYKHHRRYYRHSERSRHSRRHYGHRHNSHGYEKYVFDDGYCRTIYKYGRHVSKYTARCRDRGYRGRRAERHRRYGTGYGDGAFPITQPYYVAQTLDRAADGQSIIWNDAQEQTLYKVVPTQTYRASNGRYCREFLSTATVGGETRQVYGRACRQEDGAWELVR